MTAEQVLSEMRRQELSQAKLTRMAGVPQSTISDWLNGKRVPGVAGRQKIANALHGGFPDPNTMEEEIRQKILDILAEGTEEEAAETAEPPREQAAPAAPDGPDLRTVLLALALEAGVEINDDLGVEIRIPEDKCSGGLGDLACRIGWAQQGLRMGALDWETYTGIIGRIREELQ